MTEQQEFLDKLKHPNREPIEKDIKRWLESLSPNGILDKTYNRDKGSDVHTIKITTDDLNRFVGIDNAFCDYLPIGYAHGKSAITKAAEGPEIKNNVITFSRMYLIREY